MILRGVRVLNLSPDLSAAYCARLFADVGAEVSLLLSRPAPDRAPGHETFALDPDSTLARVLRRGHTILPPCDDPATVMAAARSADIVIDRNVLTERQLDALRSQAPGLVIVNITPFGGAGPWADRPATEFTIQALVGGTINRGSASDRPLYAAGRFGDWITGAYAAVAALAAFHRVRSGGPGEYVDVAEAEAAYIVYTMHQSVRDSMTGASGDLPTRSTPIPSVERTRDGWIGLAVNTPEHFRAYTDMIGHPELLDLPDVLNPLRREPYRATLEAAASEWLSQRTTAEVVAECSARRIPVAPVNTAADLAGLPHIVHRKLYARNGDGVPVPRGSILIDGVTADDWRPASDAQAPAVAPSRSPWDAAWLPLRGIRIVDMTTWWAGPCATQLLSALGATVIKVESHTRYDGMRDLSARGRHEPDYWEWSWQFQAINTDKLGITCDLSTEAGRAVLERLLATADLLVENGSPGVLPKLGLGWEQLQQRHPHLSLLRMPGFGLEGPWSPMRAFDPTISQALGVAALTGYPGGSPLVPRGLCDGIAGVHGAFAAIVALFASAQDGRGHHIESAMCDVLANVLLEWVLAEHGGRTFPARDGNHGPLAVPQNVYACRGSEQWLAVAVTEDVQWSAFCAVVGREDWASDRELGTAEGRRSRQEELDDGLAAWCAAGDAEALAEMLRTAGVPAERLLTPSQGLGDEQLRWRGFVETLEHPAVGTHSYPSLPFRFASLGSRGWYRRRSPMLGEDNDEVLVGQLGLTSLEMDQLREREIIGVKPTAARRAVR